MEDDLRRVAESIASLEGWDFSRMRTDRDPVPWTYEDVVRSYVSRSDTVLDIGTGGGERFLGFAKLFDKGVGIDADSERIAVANRNLSESRCSNVRFLVGDVYDLPKFDERSFDVVLNRHAPFSAAELAKVVVPGGWFVTQQVGSLNTANICREFGCGPSGDYDFNGVELSQLRDELVDAGFSIRATGEYDVPWFFVDVDSFIFWLKAIPMPRDFDISIHGTQVERLIKRFRTDRGIESNEHRLLVVAQKS